MSPRRPTISRNESLVAAALILVFTLAYLAVGYLTLDPASRSVPILAALVTTALLCLELFRLGQQRGSSGIEPIDVAHRKAWPVLLSVAALVAAIFLAGFLVAIPLYLLATIAFIGRQPLRLAFTIALTATAAIYGVFELLLSYRLYSGVLLN